MFFGCVDPRGGRIRVRILRKAELKVPSVSRVSTFQGAECYVATVTGTCVGRPPASQIPFGAVGNQVYSLDRAKGRPPLGVAVVVDEGFELVEIHQ